jgi:hypothetical protein
MNYIEAWQELNDKLYTAKHALEDLKRKTLDKLEQKRLKSKKEGINLAIQYIFDIERSLE